MSEALHNLQAIWDFDLFRFSSGGTISVGQLILVLLLLIAGYAGSRLIGNILGRRLAGTRLRPDAVHTLQRIVFYVLLIIVAMTALSLLHVPLTAFAFVSGAIAIGVGFGAQNIINNFISGWILMVERPIRIGDYVEIDDRQGVVEQVGNRSTRIRRVDGVHLLVPNSLLLERTVVNWTLVDEAIRTTVRVGVAYGSPTRRVAELILQATNEQQQVKKEPAPRVFFQDFGDNALVFDVYFWSDVTGETALRQIRSDIRMRLDELFGENGIVVAFPQRDVHLNTLAPLEVRMADSAEPGKT